MPASIQPPAQRVRCRAAHGVGYGLSALASGLFMVVVGSVSSALFAHALLPSSACANEHDAAPTWTLARRADGIEVYTRPVPGSGIKAFKGEAQVAASVTAIRSLLGDGDRFMAWFPNTPESKLLDRNEGVTHLYSVLATPWPVSDRDNIFRAVSEEDATTGSVRIRVAADPDYAPEHPDRVRVRIAQGSWLLEPLSPERTRVVFTMHLDPGGGIPQWIANTRVVDTPFEALTNMRTILGDR